MEPILDTAGSVATDIRLAANDLVSGFTLGAAVGTIIAYRRLQRGSDVDAFLIVTRWSVMGAIALPTVLATLK